MRLLRKSDAIFSLHWILLFTVLFIYNFLIKIIAMPLLQARKCLLRLLLALPGGQALHDLRVNAWSLLILWQILIDFLKGEEIGDLSLGRIVVSGHFHIDVLELIEHSIKFLTAFGRVLKIVILLDRRCLWMIWCFLGGHARLVQVRGRWLVVCWLVLSWNLIALCVMHI